MPENTAPYAWTTVFNFGRVLGLNVLPRSKVKYPNFARQGSIYRVDSVGTDPQREIRVA
jgi:hypothetical protein